MRDLWIYLTPFVLWILGVICWIVNLVKFIGCDFDSPWKEELIHAVGIFIPPASVITVWF